MFRQRKQVRSEKMNQFVLRLKLQAQKCKFAEVDKKTYKRSSNRQLNCASHFFKIKNMVSILMN